MKSLKKIINDCVSIKSIIPFMIIILFIISFYIVFKSLKTTSNIQSDLIQVTISIVQFGITLYIGYVAYSINRDQLDTSKKQNKINVELAKVNLILGVIRENAIRRQEAEINNTIPVEIYNDNYKDIDIEQTIKILEELVNG